jgi:hypothetical protein
MVATIIIGLLSFGSFAEAILAATRKLRAQPQSRRLGGQPRDTAQGPKDRTERAARSEAVPIDGAHHTMTWARIEDWGRRNPVALAS